MREQVASEQESGPTEALTQIERLRLSFLESLRTAFGSVRFRRKSRALRVEETLALGDRRMLAAVEWRGEKLLLGVTPQQITLLRTRELPSASGANGESENGWGA